MRQEIFELLFNLLFPHHARERAVRLLTPRTLGVRARTIVPPRPCTCAPLPYRDELVRTALHMLKYKGYQRAGVVFGQAIAPYLAELVAERRMFGRYHNALLVPIPLTKARLKKRGYNQSEIIAHALLAELGSSTIEIATPLTRVRETLPQVTMKGRSARYKNLAGAFRATLRLEGRDIILLDDVVTTGATLSAAQTELYRAGARDVLCIAVAH